ncbi:MAG TPA: hypothetical protein VHO90_10190 [Bacteroidales bacterium]|nr:hypothetical protein [Bacteroidales bacterium]
MTGIPDVNRGMLMFYNLGDLKDMTAKNSIFNATDANRYIEYIKFYPLPMDVVLPAFSWGIQIRRGKIIGLLNNFTETDPVRSEFVRETNCLYKVKESFFYKSFYFMKDDEIKLEVITPDIAREAAKLVSPYFKDKKATIALYHYNALKSNHYEKHDIKKVFSCFN